MKLRKLLLAGLALFSVSAFAQTHTQGIEYYKADQINNAQELLNRNLNNPGTDKSLSYYYLGQIEMLHGNTGAATKYFNDGIAADAENPYNYVGLGYAALKAGDVKTAEKYFKDAESRAKKDQSVQVEIARAYYNADPVGNQAKYEKIIANALKKDAKNPDIYIFEGDVLRENAYQTQDSKVYGSAAAKYDMATSYDPTSAVAYVKYADMYTKANNPGYAITKLEELIKNNPSSALGQRQLANLYYETQQYDKASKEYGDYVKNPNHFKSDEDRYSLILFGNSEFQKGYDYATSLLNENPNNFTAQRFQFMNAAQIDSMQGNLLPLAESLLAAHRSNPANKFAAIDYTLIADELGRAKKFDDAVAVYNEAMAEFPNNANFNRSLASMYVDSEDYDKAADAFQGYVQKTAKPGYNEYAQQAVYAYYGGLKSGDDKYFQMAVDNANNAIAANGTQYRPYKILGDVAIARAAKEDIPSVAQEDYAKAVELIEANPDPRFNNDAKTMYNYLGNFYLDKKDVAQAKKYFEKVLELEPDNADYRKFVESLK